MSQIMPPDREVGGGPGGPDVRRDHPMSTSNHPLQGESNTGESSGLIFSVYSKAAEDEDNKMVEQWQKDADGILIFTGLFSAAVAALLAVTVLDLRPSSQDTSAFYLGNIYEVLADPNVTRTPTPSPIAKPPSFSPSRSAVWVNSLWFLSLVMSLSCALWAISLQQWARRYLRRTQPARCSPEKRARMREFFLEGVENMHIQWAVEGLPMLLHLSLFLFFGGVAIFLFNVDQEVFGYVIWWIVLFCLVYGLITLLPIIRHDSPYYSPLSTPAWLLYAGIPHVALKTLATTAYRSGRYGLWVHYRDLSYRYQTWILGGVEKAAEETATKWSRKIDVQILERTIGALGDDNSLKSLFEAIPRSFNSKMLGHLKNIKWTLRDKIESTLEGFCERTLASNSISDSEKVRRLDIANNAINQLSGDDGWMMYMLYNRTEDVPQTIEMGHTAARWLTNNGHDGAQQVLARILVNVRERNHSWVTLALRVFGLSEQELRDNVALGGDSVLLAILIHITRLCLRFDYWPWNRKIFEALSKLDIRNTDPGLQHEFCTLWNETVQEARIQARRPLNAPVYILRYFRLHYIAIHQGTDAAPTEFHAYTYENDSILHSPSSYPFCHLAGHHPDSTAHVSVPLPTPHLPDAFLPSATEGDNTASRKAEQVSNVVKLPSSPNPTPNNEIRPTSHGPDLTPQPNPVDSSSCPKGASPTAVVAVLPQDVTSTAALSHSPDTVAPSAEPGTSIPTSLLNVSSESNDAGVASAPANLSQFAFPSPYSSAPAPRLTGNPAHPRLRARGLVNTKNICFANAVLQVLVNSPPFWNLFRELADLKRQRGAGAPETEGSEIPLVDATVRFFKEYMLEEGSQPDTSGISRTEGDKKGNVIDGSFEPTYLYDTMKEKQQLKTLLDGRQQDAEEFFSLYLDALDQEILALLPSISDHRPPRVALGAEERETSQSGQVEVESQGFTANFVESPITRIFRGKSRLSNSFLPDPATGHWRLLHLDIQSDSVLTVQDALMGIFSTWSMRLSPLGFMARPRGPTVDRLSDASQQRFIEVLPPVLVLHLKRFQEDGDVGRAIKIGKSIQLSPELEIPSDIMMNNPSAVCPEGSAKRPSKPPRYKLYGVLHHHGESAGNGHYTVDVHHPDGDSATGENWLHIDDEAVTRSRMGHVFKFGDGERLADGRSAYLLFYWRIYPT